MAGALGSSGRTDDVDDHAPDDRPHGHAASLGHPAGAIFAQLLGRVFRPRRLGAHSGILCAHPPVAGWRAGYDFGRAIEPGNRAGNGGPAVRSGRRAAWASLCTQARSQAAYLLLSDRIAWRRAGRCVYGIDCAAAVRLDLRACHAAPGRRAADSTQVVPVRTGGALERLCPARVGARRP